MGFGLGGLDAVVCGGGGVWLLLLCPTNLFPLIRRGFQASGRVDASKPRGSQGVRGEPGEKLLGKPEAPGGALGDKQLHIPPPNSPKCRGSTLPNPPGDSAAQRSLPLHVKVGGVAPLPKSRGTVINVIGSSWVGSAGPRRGPNCLHLIVPMLVEFRLGCCMLWFYAQVQTHGESAV